MNKKTNSGATASQPKSAKRKPRRRTRGALAAVGGLLLASAALRVTIGAGEAFARESESGSEMLATRVAATAEAPVVMQASEPEVMALLDRLNAREERIEKRELALEVRMQALAVAETEIERRLVALENAEDSLRATLALAETAAEDDLDQLTQVYANMKPKQASALFDQMDPQFAAGFLGRMRAESAADIMANMTPETAYLVSVILAGRNADVPKE